MKLNSLMKSRRPLLRSLCPAVLAVLALTISAKAAVVLAVDFGGGTGNLQSGFQGFTNPADGAITATQTYSGITVTLDGGTNPAGTAGYLNARSRGNAPANAGSYTNSALLRDRIVASGGGNGLLLTIGGLLPDTNYTLQVWGYDTRAAENGGGARPGTNMLHDLSRGDDTKIGQYTMAAGELPVDNNSFSITATVMTSSSGLLIVRSFNADGDWIDGPGIMNGFVLSQVPEPSASLLTLAGAGFVLARRRRQA